MNESNMANTKVVDLDLDDVLPNRFQPRIKFNEDSIIELSESIKEHGVIQPIVVRKIGDKYEIIAGERRYKASVLAGRDTIPAIVTDLNEKESAEVALIENIQRRDLTPIEEAISYKKILDMNYLTQEQLAIKLGKSQSAVANKIRLLNLSDCVQEALMEDKISERHARALLKLKESSKQKEMLDKIIKERLTVRKTEEEIEKMNTFITNPIDDEPVETSSVGTIDANQFLSNVQDIIPAAPQVDMDALLKPAADPVEPVKQDNVVTNNFTSAINLDDVLSVPTVPKVEAPTVPTVETLETKEPEIPVMPDLMAAPAPQAEPVPTVPPVEDKPLSFADLMAAPAPQAEPKQDDMSQQSLVDLMTAPMPQAEAPTVPPVETLTAEVETLDTIPQTSALEEIEMPTIKPLSVEAPVMPSTPIMENESLPGRFFDTKEEPEILPEVTPVPTEEEEEEEIPTIAEETPTIEPIVITDYSKQYDPILPETSAPQEKVDFKEIINIIRKLNDTIEACGYSIDTEEYDLTDTYQVTIKIDKN